MWTPNRALLKLYSCGKFVCRFNVKRNIRYIFLSSCFFYSLGCNAYADDTQAVYFAKQAGVIAGLAEACGQPISVMVMRSGEVIEALAVDPTDKTYATAAFEKARQDANATQVQSQKVACPKVIADFNSLPLLQPDYEKTVVSPLVANNPKKTNSSTGMPVTPSSQTASSSTSTQPPVTPPAGAPLLPSQTSQMNSAASWTQPSPAQQYVNPSMANPAAVNVASGQTNPGNPQTNQQNAEMARLQLAQQLATMAQSLVNNSAVIMPTPANSPGMNTQLYGVGANNPIFTGTPLPPANLAPPAQPH